ncbi:MAG: O-antigen ligase family protein [Geminicoccaceae bacterium]|nr:O-antigen ligase family protein [Geminicoccaceae bacterium]
MLVFPFALAALLGAALVRVPRLPAREPTVPLLLAAALAVVLVLDAVLGEVDPLDYRIALLLPILFFGSNLARAAERVRLAELAWWSLTAYVVATAALAWFAPPPAFVRGRADLVRLDFSGSLVAHAGLCTIHLVATLARLAARRGALVRFGHGGLALLAGAMVLATGTRTALAALFLSFAFDFATASRPSRPRRRILVYATGLCAAIGLYSISVSDDFVERLFFGSGADWSSGRLASQLFWLLLALERPWGSGFGAVRERLRDGRPSLDGTNHLEWPHNEPLRFFVEAGVVGLFFVGLLVGWLVRRTLRAARRERDEERRALLSAIAADMITQCLFQNYFNNIYYATTLCTLLVVLIEQAERRDETTRAPAHARAPLSNPAPAT